MREASVMTMLIDANIKRVSSYDISRVVSVLTRYVQITEATAYIKYTQ